MKNLKSFLLVIVAVVSACTTTGYTVDVCTPQLRYSTIKDIEDELQREGFKMRSHEEKAFNSDVQTFLVKEINKKEYGKNKRKYGHLEVYIKYDFDSDLKFVNNAKVIISNIYVGLSDSEIKKEIDRLGQYYYDYLSKIVGEDNVMFEKNEWGPPVFY